MASAFASAGHLQDVRVRAGPRLLAILRGCEPQRSSPRGFWLWILLMLKIAGCCCLSGEAREAGRVRPFGGAGVTDEAPLRASWVELVGSYW